MGSEKAVVMGLEVVTGAAEEGGGRLDEALEVGLETEVQKNTLLQHEVEHGVRSGDPGTHVLEGSPLWTQRGDSSTVDRWTGVGEPGFEHLRE